MRTESWTVEQIDLLKKLWAEGKTAAAIAAQLGDLSRSAVLGKVHRLRLRTAKAAAANATSARQSRRRQSGSTRRCLN
jgi:GcrA cell cycle regulator